jgi:hypothetical protein
MPTKTDADGNMTLGLLLWPLISLVLLAAHFARAQQWPLTLACAALMGVLALRRRWVPWTLQAALVLGAAEWLRTLLALVASRLALGQPYGRLAAILAAVALLTLGSALVFRVSAVRARYRVPR